MNEATLDKMISDAAPTNDAPAATPATPEAAPAPAKVEPQDDNGPDEGDVNDVHTPFPKKAINAIQRRDKQLNKYRSKEAEYNQQLSDAAFLERRLNEIKAKSAAPSTPAINPNDPEPNIANYKDFTKYQDDRQDWRQRQKEYQKTATEQVTKTSTESRAWAVQREAIMDQQAAEITAKNPEYMNIVQENADILSGFAQPIKDAFLKVDHAIIGIAVLAQEGTLEDLADMSPALAEKFIQRAVQRGMAQTNTEAEEQIDTSERKQRVSAAPTPMAPARTAGTSGSKSGLKLSNKDFRNTYLKAD